MTTGAPLVAVTRPLGVEVDPLDAAGHDGHVWIGPDVAFGARGVAARIAVPLQRAQVEPTAATVESLLTSIEHRDEVGRRGAGPLALGALPFSPGATGELVVPEVLVGHAADGTRWITTVAPTGSPIHDSEPVEALDERIEPHHFDIDSMRTPEEWCDAVAACTKRIVDGDATKVVLAREVRVTADRPFSRRAVLDRLRHTFPGTMVFSLGPIVGASPELLVSRHGTQVRSHPLAGTTARSADPTSDARLAARLLASAKDRWEHQITIDRVHETLLPHCSYLDAEAEPSVVAVANVQHLGTMVEGQLSLPAPSALELALRLHPTPAVGGEPQADALAMIDELEGLDRGCYAGPAGWVDAEGNGTWAVAIRSAEIDGAVARVFAGVGIVADSDPVAELDESRNKLQAVLGALVRP